MNNLDKQYTNLLQDILDNGVEKKDRTGTGTISVFGRQIRHKMSEGFPLLTTKKMHWKSIVTELLWFLRGDTNIKYLVDNGCHIWDGDCYKAFEKWKQEIDAKIRRENPTIDFQPLEYESKEEFVNKIKTDDEFAKKWGDLGPIYGKQWRNWTTNGFNKQSSYNKESGNFVIDQIANLINDLKTNPDSRRLMVNAWNVGEIDQMVLPPCHYGFQVYTRELSLDERNDLLYKKIGGNHKRENCFDVEEFERETLQDCNAFKIPTRAISLMWNQRSVDTFLGLPFNIASYGLLLEIIAKEVNMVPDELIGNLGDVHLYSNHVEQAKEQIGKLTWEEREKFLTDEQRKEFGKIDPFTSKMIQWWLDSLNIPYSKKMPYPLPTLKHMKTSDFYKSLSDNQSLYFHLDNSDFELENYQSHPAIKAPLSN